MDVFEKLCLLPAFLVKEGTIIVVVIGSSQKGKELIYTPFTLYMMKCPQ